jgi:ribosomal protein L11 methyltransferase
VLWRELTISFPIESKEPITAVLYAHGCEGMSEEDGRIMAYFPEDVATDEVMDALTGFGNITTAWSGIAEQDWQAGWKEGVGPFRVAGLLICPPWKTCTPEAGETLITIDPGAAFGAGEHETTRMMLNMLREWADAQEGLSGKRLLDLGTGTGILSIAAHVLGVGDVTAADVEQRAVDTARVNLALNGLSDKVRLIHGGMSDAGTGYDVILANIFLEVLIEVMPEAARALKPGGTLILSGLLKGQEDEVIASARAAGLELYGVREDGRWVGALFTGGSS